MVSGGGASRFFASYYISNFALIASYAAVRLWFLEHSDLKYSKFPTNNDLLSKEQQAFSLLAVAVVMKFVRRQSMDGFLSDAFFFCKSAIGLLAWYMDLRLLAYYLIMYTFVALLFPQPMFKGPARMEYFTPAAFAELVEDRRDGEVSWLVEFFAPWAPQCLFLEPVIAEISVQYTTSKLRFGKIDVSRWPAMATKYKINVTGVSNQLPTLIMFEKGKEAGRIPHVSKDGKVAAGKYRRQDIVTAFELEERATKIPGLVKTQSPAAGGTIVKKRK